MSTVATFTVRDLSRRTAELLDAVRKHGSAEICARSGEVFTLATKGRKRGPKKADILAAFIRESEERAQCFREMGYVPPKPGEWDEERFNRIIAGEE